MEDQDFCSGQKVDWSSLSFQLSARFQPQQARDRGQFIGAIPEMISAASAAPSTGSVDKRMMCRDVR